MKYRFAGISGPQIEAGVEAYCDWLDQNEPDAIANLVCEVHLAMNRDGIEKIFQQSRQSDQKSAEQSS